MKKPYMSKIADKILDITWQRKSGEPTAIISATMAVSDEFLSVIAQARNASIFHRAVDRLSVHQPGQLDHHPRIHQLLR